MTLAIESSALLQGSSAPPRRGKLRGASRSHYALQPTETLGLSAWLLGTTGVKENRPPVTLRCRERYVSVAQRFYGSSSRRPRAWSNPRISPSGRPGHPYHRVVGS